MVVNVTGAPHPSWGPLLLGVGIHPHFPKAGGPEGACTKVCSSLRTAGLSY